MTGQTRMLVSVRERDGLPFGLSLTNQYLPWGRRQFSVRPHFIGRWQQQLLRGDPFGQAVAVNLGDNVFELGVTRITWRDARLAVMSRRTFYW